MATSNADLSAKLAARGAAMVPSGFEQNVKGWYAANRKRLVALAGGSEDKAALHIAAAFAQVNRIPKLIECTPESIYHCILFSLGTGLLPGPMQECVFIPFSNVATFVPMYQGLVKLAYNSGFVTRISGHVIWEADEFDYDPATETIHHRLFSGPEAKRGNRIGAYCVIKNRYGEIQPTVRFAEFVESIKARSKAAKSSDSPWNSKYPGDVDSMWLKTVFKQAAKWVPKSATPQGLAFGQALELDNRADSGDDSKTLDLPEELGEVAQKILDAPRQQEALKLETDKEEVNV